MSDEDGASATQTRTGAEQAKALDKVTDAEEKDDLKSLDSTKIQDAMKTLEAKQAAQAAEDQRREKELAAVTVDAADVKTLTEAFDVDGKVADRRLRECGGDLSRALESMLDRMGAQ
ncbi:hypothetical protein H632_c1964p0 [Helicosporidium sp. ATCC 50920]|nr:hypothetical protein H632_c1964p0 [Helicosporidium sp. ATCC 50920]|eukprot:KDD73647.1 hypothetical protein H632_c1964p0 [Helicosporidium sp. ATCC 50920]